MIQRKLLRLSVVGQKVFDYAQGLEITVFVDVHLFALRIGRLHQRRFDLVIANVDIGLPLVERTVLGGVLRFDVVNGGQVTVAAGVINRQGRALVVAGSIGATERCSDDRGICRKVHTQHHTLGFTSLTDGFLRNGEYHALIHISATGRVNRRRHESLPG